MESLERKDTMTGPDEPIKSEGIVPSPDTSERSNGAASPPPNCSICLGKLVNTSFTDSCLHQFCFTCLLQWSKIKTECPLCKQTFKSIIHNVRSEEDYDQYHVQYTSQVAATLDVTADINISGHWDAVGIPIRPFMYRTTMGGANRRYGVYLNPEAVARREQIPSVAAQVSNEERRRRTANPTDYRRTVYRQAVWAASLPDAFGRYRVSSAEYYRRHPTELNRLIPWLNRELQVLLNNNRPQIAYVMSVITDNLTRYDIHSVEFSDIVRPYFGIHTDHFVHELSNFARSNFDLVGYDQAVTYIPNRGLSNEYVSRAISPTPSTSSSASSDSDIRILNDGLGNNRYDPRYLDMPGPSTVAQAFRIQLPYTAPDILTISSTSSSSENECEIIGYVKPRHERTPEIVDLSSSEAEVNVASSQSTSASTSHENTQTEALLPLKEENLPSTSSSGNNNNSRQTRRRTEDITKAKMFDYYLDSSSAESDREEIDSDYNPSSTKPRRHKGAPKKSSKKVTRKLRSRKRKRTTVAQRKRTKTRTRSSYSSFCSDNESPAREAASSSRGTKRYLQKNSDESGNEKVTKKNKRSKKAKCSKRPKKRITSSSSTSKAVCRNYSSSSSSSLNSDSDSDTEAENNKNNRRRPMKSSATTNSSHCTSSDDRSDPEKVSITARRTRRRTDSCYSDTDPSDYRRSESSRHSSVESPNNRDNWPLLNTDSSLRNTSEEEIEKKEEEEESRSPDQRSSSASSDDPSSYSKKTNSSKSMTAVTTTTDASTSQATSQSSERLSSAAATPSTTTTTTTTASSASASSLKSDSPTEHSPSTSKTTRERHRSHKKRKESKKRRRSRS